MSLKNQFKDQMDTKPIDIKWLIAFSLLIWLICILVPFIFSLAMKINFNATIDAIDAHEFQLTTGDTNLELSDPDLDGGLSGAQAESFKKTVSTEYRATLVPIKLDEQKGPFLTIGFLHGPALVSGASLIFDAVPESVNQDLVASASIRLSSIATPIVFFLVFILFVLFIDWVLGNPNSALRFVVTLSLIWFVWSIFTWALGGLTMRPVNDILNQMLTSEQGAAQFSLGPANIITAPLRIFLAGTLVWVGSFFARRAKLKSTVAADDSDGFTDLV